MVKFNTISDQCKLAQTYNLVPGGGEGEPVLVWAATFPTILENKFLYCAISLATFSPPSQRMFRNQRKKLEETVELERMRTVIRMSAFSLPKAALLLVSTKNRELWEGPHGKSAIHGSTSQLSLCACLKSSLTNLVGWEYETKSLRILKNRNETKVAILGADQKERSPWGRWLLLANFSGTRSCVHAVF